MEKNKEKSFEEKLIALESIVKKLESGDIPLDEAINGFNEAMSLAKDCNKTLEEAEKTITKVVTPDALESDFEIDQ